MRGIRHPLPGLRCSGSGVSENEAAGKMLSAGLWYNSGGLQCGRRRYLEALLVPVVQGLKVSLKDAVQTKGCAQLGTVRLKQRRVGFHSILFFKANMSQ